jgi:hypothetical protein
MALHHLLNDRITARNGKKQFIIEPHRLWRRYLIGNPLFLWRVLKQRLALSDASLWIAGLSKGLDVVTRLARPVQVCYISAAGAALD